ncbi:MAG: type II secretion system F family protein [Elusimicrobia bacterium]|nr:type II secretion system F family protein [Elusimicrobiota bacterium]MDE2314080.1 type II secretion system F family protein [Elusimicrobiota bacterium]
MPTFAYKAKARDGAVRQGTLDAAERRVAIELLRSQKMVVLEIGEKKPSFLDTLKDKLNAGATVKSKDLTMFSRQLSTLIGAGVPIVQGLSILEAQAQNPAFKKIIGAVRADIEGGLSITEAMKKHPGAFPELYTSMVKAGELGGILDVILERLTLYLENSEALRAKVKSALMYPAVVLSICALVTVFLLTFVVPTFKTIFSAFGGKLPMPTQVLLGISAFMRTYWYAWVPIPIGIGYAFKRFYKTPAGKRRVDSWILKAPLFGPILTKVAIAKLTRTLGTLIKSGVPIMQGLETAAATAGNVVVSEAILSSRESVREGGKLTDPLKKSGLFPNMVTSMISVGEETGSLDAMLGKIADFYDMEVDAAVKGLTSMIEPIVIVIMGVIVGSIVIAMFMPIFELGQLASNMGSSKRH